MKLKHSVMVGYAFTYQYRNSRSWVLPLVTSIGEIIVFLPYKIYLNDYYLLKTEKRRISLSR